MNSHRHIKIDAYFKLFGKFGKQNWKDKALKQQPARKGAIWSYSKSTDIVKQMHQSWKP